MRDAGSRTPRICLAGKNRIAVDALLFMIAQGWKDRLMVCPNRADDGATDWRPSLLRFAMEPGIKVVSSRPDSRATPSKRQRTLSELPRQSAS